MRAVLTARSAASAELEAGGFPSLDDGWGAQDQQLVPAQREVGIQTDPDALHQELWRKYSTLEVRCLRHVNGEHVGCSFRDGRWCVQHHMRAAEAKAVSHKRGEDVMKSELLTARDVHAGLQARVTALEADNAELAAKLSRGASPWLWLTLPSALRLTPTCHV